jgi:hypothetical protein
MGSFSISWITIFPPRITLTTIYSLAHLITRNCFNLWEIPFYLWEIIMGFTICFGSISPIHYLELPTNQI